MNHCVMSSDCEQSTLSDFVMSSDCEQPALSDIVISSDCEQPALSDFVISSDCEQPTLFDFVMSSDCIAIVSRHDNHAAATSIPSGVPAQFCFLLAASSESM